MEPRCHLGTPIIEEEAARKAAEEEAARKAAEEEAARKAAEEAAAAEAAAAAQEAAEEEAPEQEAVEKPADEETVPPEETPAQDDASEEEGDEDGLVQLDDNWGYVDREVIEENTPAITDELKGIRKANLTVGKTLKDTLEFGDELVITLKASDASAVLLKLYAPSGASINTKVDGIVVSFTPADSDVPSKDLSIYELTNAAGRSHEIVLTSYDTVSFELAAVADQAEVTSEGPAAQEEEKPAADEKEETPATEKPAEEKPADNKPAEQKPAETPAPTVQASVKTYDALKAGHSISDNLIAGQKAKIQVKCGKNPYITLTLNANPSGLNVSIDGQGAKFTAAGNGTWICELDEVAFRKFSVVISAKQDLDFTLTATARQVEEEAPAAEETDETPDANAGAKEEPEAENKDEQSDTINIEETGEEPAEEAKEESAGKAKEEAAGEEKEETPEEPAEEAAGVNAEEPAEEAEDDPAEEAAEEVTEEAAGETTEETAEEEPAEEASGEAGEEAAEETTEEPAGEAGEEVTEEPAEEAEEEASEETTEETEEPVEGEEENTEEEDIPGIKVTVTAEEGADLYAAPGKGADVIGHLDAGTEIRVVLNEEQTWGQIVSEDEDAAAQFICMEDAEIAAVEETAEEASEETEEEPEEAAVPGIKVIITAEEGADVYAEADRAAEVVGHLDAGTEVRVILNEEQTWGRLYSEDEEAAAQFICMEDAEIAAAEEEAEEETEPLTDEQLEELGYRKVQVLNQDGVDIYDSTTEEAAVIGHADFESELWIKDAEAEGWAEIYTAEEETGQFVKTADIEKQLTFEEQMLKKGYWKAQIALLGGADTYAAMDKTSAVVAHLDVGAEIWVKIIRGTEWAEVYSADEEGNETQKQFITWDSLVITLRDENEDDDIGIRSVTISSSLDEMEFVYYGTDAELTATLDGFQEDDVYTVQWMYSSDEGENFYNIEEANELTYTFSVMPDNIENIWRIVIILLPKE